MRYMLLIHDNEQAWQRISKADEAKVHAEFGALIGEMKAKGQYITGAQLQPTPTATSVRVRDGKRMVTDGPFAETREQLGGYFLVEAANLDEAIALASRIPSARTGTIEVRPVVEMQAPTA